MFRPCSQSPLPLVPRNRRRVGEDLWNEVWRCFWPRGPPAGICSFRWLDTVFHGQYLTSLKLNKLRRHKQRFEKIATTVVLDKDETTMRWNCMSKALCLLQITVEHQDCPYFTVFVTIKTSSQSISITLLQISLKLHERRGGYWRKSPRERFW